MSSESLETIIKNLKDEINEKTRQLEEANSRASKLQKQLDQNVNESSSKEVNFAEVWKENKILRRVIAKETEEVHSVYEKCVTVIQKYQELEAQYKEVLSILLNAEPASGSQGLFAKLQKENQENKAALETMTNKFTDEKNKCTALEGQFKQVKEELEALKSSDPELNDKAKLLEEINQLKEKLNAKESEVDKLNTQVTDLTTKLEMGKYGVNDEAPQALDDFINQSKVEESEASEIEAKYDAEKEERESKTDPTKTVPLNMPEIITSANSRERALLLRIAELESQLNELKDKTGFELISNNGNGENQNKDGKSWSFVPRVNVQERGVNLLGISNREEEDEIDPHNLPNVDVSAINSPKPEDRLKLASNSDEENLDENIDLDSEYEALLNKENVANKELITKLMDEVRKLRKELRKDKKERRELVERLERSGSILGSVPTSPKAQIQDDDYENYTSNEVETETDNNDERATDRLQIVTRVANIVVEEEEEQPEEQSSPINAEYTDEAQSAEEAEATRAAEEAEAARAAKQAEEIAELLDRPAAENLDEANTRIKLLEDQIKKLVDQINSLQVESSLNTSAINGNDSLISHDFQSALKRIAKLQKKLDDRSKPPENMQQFEDEIARLRTELQESSNHAQELQSLLDSFSKTTNNGVVEVVKENQNMKKTIERKDKEIEDATKKGADILAKYNEQQNTIKTLINELKAAKAKNNESQRAISELNASVEQLQQDLDQADADAESYKDDLTKLDEITAKFYLVQTELDTTKIKLDKTMALLKTKGGPRAIYALEEYDNIVGYKAEISAQKELLKEIEEILGLPQDSLLNLVDKEGQPRPAIENEDSENQQEQQQEEETNNEERIQKTKEALRKLLQGVRSPGAASPVEVTNHLLFESDNDFFNECDKLTKENQRMRTILAQIEEELHLEPGRLTNRQIEDELVANEGQENSESNHLPSGWLNNLVAENNDGNGLSIKTRDINLKKDEEEEEEESEKGKEIERLNAENTNHQSKIGELEGNCENLRRQIVILNNKISMLDTDRLTALQTNTILADKCADLQSKLTKAVNKLKASGNNLNTSLNVSANESNLAEFENDYRQARQRAEEFQNKIERLRSELGKAKAELQRTESLENQVSELSSTINEMKKEKTELQRRIAELEITNA